MAIHKVTKGDRTEHIPDIWLAGFCTANRCSVEDAIAWWFWQSGLESLEALS